jgi:hypothetical protein
MSHIETQSNCLVIPVTEKNLKPSRFPVGGAGGGIGCLIITVTENQSKLWSITLSGSKARSDQNPQATKAGEIAESCGWLKKET